MGVDLYLFDAHQTVRRVLADGVSRLIHNEAEWLLTADIPMDAQAEPGEFLGFLCIDGAFRLFRIDSAEDNERERTTSIEATDAGVSELAGKVVRSVRLEDTDARTAFGAILQGTGWVLGTVTAGRTGKIDVYYQPAWQAMQSVRPIYDARIVVRYELEGNRIAGRVVDVLKKESVFRGRFFDSAVDAEAVYITKSGLPVTVMYGIGKSTSTGDKPDKLTFADVAWSKAGGDPADKPAGQDWIGDPEAIAKYGRIEAVHQNQYQDDPAKLLRETWDELQKASKPTVTVTATVQDMELVPGYEHQSVRIWDRAGVVLRDGTVLDTTVTGIERDYVEPWLTKIKTGDEEHDEPSIAREVAKTNNDLSMLSDRVGGHGAGIAENRQFIVEDKEIIRLHTIQIDEQGHAINEAMIELNNGKITLEAHQKKLNAQDELISQAMIEIDGVNARVDIYAANL